MHWNSTNVFSFLQETNFGIYTSRMPAIPEFLLNILQEGAKLFPSLVNLREKFYQGDTKTNQTRSHPEMVGNMSRATLNFNLSKLPFVRF